MAENVIELASPLYLAIGGVTYRVHIISNANHILMRDGADVETRINTLERGLAANTTMRFAEDIASRDALSGLTPGDCCHVTDAKADATVARGGALYIWLPSLQWKKICNIDLPLDCFKVIAERGGLAVDGDGKMYVDFANLSQELKKRNAEALLRANDCLAADDAGRIWLDVAKISFAPLTDAQKKQIMGGKAILQLDFSQMSEAQKRELLAGLSVTYLDFSKLTARQISDILGGDHVAQIDFCQLTETQKLNILGGDHVRKLDFSNLTAAQRIDIMGGSHVRDLDFAQITEQQKKNLVSGDIIRQFNFTQVSEEQKGDLLGGTTVNHISFEQANQLTREQITKIIDTSRFTETQIAQLLDGNAAAKLDFSQLTAAQQAIITEKVKIKPGGGILRDAAGLYVDFSDVDQTVINSVANQITEEVVNNITNEGDLINNITQVMVKPGFGLSTDADGRLYVDFASMPDSVKEDIQKAIRVPIWITAAKTFYVDKKHAKASDAVSGAANKGRGESASLPFKTIQACINYICENYNIGKHTVTINVASSDKEASGYDPNAADDYDYYERLDLPEFSRTTGRIILKSADWRHRFVLNCQPSLNGTAMTALPYGVRCIGGAWEVDNIRVKIMADFSANTAVAGVMNAFTCSGNADMRLRRHSCSMSLRGVPKNASGTAVAVAINCYYANGGRLDLYPANVKNTTISEANGIGYASSIGVNRSDGNASDATLMTISGGGQIRCLTQTNTADAVYNGHIRVYGNFREFANIANATLTASINSSFEGAGKVCFVPEDGLDSIPTATVRSGGKVSLGIDWGQRFNRNFLPGNQSWNLDANTYCWLSPSQTKIS